MASSGKTGLYVGLAVSVVFVIVVVVTFIKVSMGGGDSLGSPTDVTYPAPGLEKIVLKIDPNALVKVPEGGSGAEAAYLDAYKLAQGQGLGFVVAAKLEDNPIAKPEYKAIIDKLIEASDMGMSTGELNFDAADSMGPLTEYGLRDRLAAMAGMLEKAGINYRVDKNREMSEKCFRAGFVFGYRLWTYGLYVPYKKAGLGAMGGAAAGMRSGYSADWYNDPAKAEKAGEMMREIKETAITLEAKMKDIAPHRDPNTIVPADLKKIADMDKDRAWRIEAITWLGVVQWTNAGTNKRAAIQKYLEEMSRSSDPVIAEKAKAAAAFPRKDVGLVPGA